MRDVTFGSYFPAESFVHKMDARAKILIAIAYMVAVFLVSSFHFLGFAACLLFVMIATVAAKVPFLMVIKSIRTIIFFVSSTTSIKLPSNFYEAFLDGKIEYMNIYFIV